MKAFFSVVIYSLVEKPEAKRKLGRPLRRWKGDTKMTLKEIGWEGLVWIILAKDMDTWRVIERTFWTLVFHTRWEICLLNEEMLAFQEGLSCT
jgi:hypothetical protein